MSDIKIPEAVMERVHAELVHSIMETPNYINQIVSEVLKEPGKYNSRDDDYGKPLFERILRQQLREIVRTSLVQILREKYQPTIDAAVRSAVEDSPPLQGSLAEAFGLLLKDDYRVSAAVTFKIERDD